MSKIEAERKSIPLFEVVEHIVGDLGQIVLQYEDIGPKESGLLQTAGEEFSGARVPAPRSTWQVLLPVDGAIVSAWEGAWKKLSAAVRDGELPVRGFRGGSEFSEEIKPEEFPELWHNRYSDFDLNVEYCGHRFLEFDEFDKAEIRKGYSIGASAVIWAGLYAVSGAEVLRLWPSVSRRDFELTDDELDDVIRKIVEREGRVPSQNECADFVRADYPRVTRDRVRDRLAQMFPDLKQGRGSRKKCAE